MEELKELDIVRTISGIEVTILEVFHVEPFYLVETMDDKLLYLESTEVKGLVIDEDEEKN